MVNFLLYSKNKKNIHNSGQAMLFSVVLFVFIALAIVGGLVSPVARDYKVSQESFFSRRSYYVAESGVEDIFYRTLQTIPMIGSGTYTLDVNGDQASIEVGSLSGGERTITSTGNRANRKRSIRLKVQQVNWVVFNTGLQFGKGGLTALGSNSSLFGTITSMGPVSGTNLNNVTSGGAISSGNTGSVSNLKFNSGAYGVFANSIINSVISGFAYYQSIDPSSLVGGAACPNAHCFPGYPNHNSYSLPITDLMISKTEQVAASGTVYGGPCPYNIISGTTNLGPTVVNCSSMNISGTATVNVNGPIWIKGNLSISGSARLALGASIPMNKSVMVIADKTDNHSTSSQISINTSSGITGMGSDSFVVLVSMNNDSENGGVQDAIDLINGGSTGSALIAYAPHGNIDVQTSDASGMVRLTSGYKAVLTGTNTILAGRSTSTNVSFSNNLSLWNVNQWKEI